MRFKGTNPPKWKMRRTTPATHRPKSVDVLLQRLAWVGQITLVVVAIFGYFYSVRPLYQKYVLDEEVARQRMVLATLQADANKLRSQAELLAKDNQAKYGFILNWAAVGVRNYFNSECLPKVQFDNGGILWIEQCLMQASTATHFPGYIRTEDSERFKGIVSVHFPQVRPSVLAAQQRASESAAHIRAQKIAGTLSEDKAEELNEAVRREYRVSVAALVEKAIYAASKEWRATARPPEITLEGSIRDENTRKWLETIPK